MVSLEASFLASSSGQCIEVGVQRCKQQPGHTTSTSTSATIAAALL
jgi:hypothetical protein